MARALCVADHWPHVGAAPEHPICRLGDVGEATIADLVYFCSDGRFIGGVTLRQPDAATPTSNVMANTNLMLTSSLKSRSRFSTKQP